MLLRVTRYEPALFLLLFLDGLCCVTSLAVIWLVLEFFPLNRWNFSSFAVRTPCLPEFLFSRRYFSLHGVISGHFLFFRLDWCFSSSQGVIVSDGVEFSRWFLYFRDDWGLFLLFWSNFLQSNRFFSKVPVFTPKEVFFYLEFKKGLTEHTEDTEKTRISSVIPRPSSFPPSSFLVLSNLSPGTVSGCRYKRSKAVRNRRQKRYCRGRGWRRYWREGLRH